MQVISTIVWCSDLFLYILLSKQPQHANVLINTKQRTTEEGECVII